MCPRPYDNTNRRAVSGRTRQRIIYAARQVLLSEGRFSIDAVAKEADVARMTVYYQFGSRRELLEAMFDDIGQRALFPGLPSAMSSSDPAAALEGAVRAFWRLWESDPLLIRRVQALAVLDPDLDAGLRDRSARRRHAFREIAGRLAKAGYHTALPQDDAVDVLYALTSFATYQVIVEGRTSEQALAIVLRLARNVAGLPDAPTASAAPRKRPPPASPGQTPRRTAAPGAPPLP